MLSLATVAVIATAGAGAFASGGFDSDCPERRAGGVEATVSDWPGEGSFFDIAPRSPLLMP